MRGNQRAVIATLVVALIAVVAVTGFAQTSASWTFNGDGNWSDNTKWTPAAFPNGGGTATFNLHPLQSQIRAITLDTPVTLGGMTFNSSYQWNIVPASTNTFTLNGAATIGVPTSNAGSPSVFAAGDTISAPIAGSSALVKTGAGVLTLSATNTYTGGTTINGGVLRVSANAGLGSTASGNDITLNGGALRWTAALTTARNITLNGGILEAQTGAGTFTGVLSGGDLNKTLTAAVVFQGANTYTGASNFQALGTQNQTVTSGGTITFSAAGTALATSSITSGGIIILDNSATTGAASNINGRLNSSAPMTLHGAGVTVIGNAAVGTVEAVGGVTGDAGLTTFVVTPNAAQAASLTIASFTRANSNTQVYRGTNLGNAPGAGVANIFLTAAPTLVGGGGAAGTTNISIIPTAVGGITASGGVAGPDLVTYGATGVRPLSNAAGEYATLAAANATDNVLITSALSTSGNKTINALVFGGSGASLTQTGSDVITVTSGMVLFGSSAFPQNNFNLEFGSTTGILDTTNNGPAYNGAIGGTGGLIITGANISLGGASTFSGPTTILGGIVTLGANVPANANSPFGNSADPIIIEPGSATAGTNLPNITGPSVIIGRDIIARGNGSGTASISNSPTGAGTVTLNGTITLERQLDLSAAPLTANGVIHGTGRLSAARTLLLNNANTYSGGTNLTTGAVYAGHNNAFGTGTIFLSATGTGAAGTGTIGAVGAPRTIANPLVILGNLTIGNTPLVGTAADITFTGDVNLGGGNSGTAPADGPCTLTVPTGLTATFSGLIHDGGITKTGPGKLILSGNNTYTGGTIVNAGILQIDNTVGSGTGLNSVTVTLARLAGIGSIAGAVSLDGGSTLAPGDSPGTLTTGALTLANNTTLEYELNQAVVAGSGVNDLTAVNGNLVLDGVLNVIPGPSFGNGLYPLFTYSGSLTDNTVSVNPLPSGKSGTIDTSTTPGVVYLDVVPEPATLGLLGLAAPLAMYRRRRVA